MPHKVPGWGSSRILGKLKIEIKEEQRGGGSPAIFRKLEIADFPELCRASLIPLLEWTRSAVILS